MLELLLLVGIYCLHRAMYHVAEVEGLIPSKKMCRKSGFAIDFHSRNW